MTTPSFRADCLSVFTVEGPTTGYPKGRLIPCHGNSPVNALPSRLQDYRYDALGRHYEENHLEEWVARCPQALFPTTTADVIASQNHAHMSEKVDLLMLENRQHFVVVEVKAEVVSAHGGESPYQLYNDQLGRYVVFLRRHLAEYPQSHEDYYARFSKRFFGRQCSPPSLCKGTLGVDATLAKSFWQRDTILRHLRISGSMPPKTGETCGLLSTASS